MLDTQLFTLTKISDSPSSHRKQRGREFTPVAEKGVNYYFEIIYILIKSLMLNKLNTKRDIRFKTNMTNETSYCQKIGIHNSDVMYTNFVFIYC